MTEQLRGIIEHALKSGQHTGPAGRAEVYGRVRRRLESYIAGRLPALKEEQTIRLVAALERTITEIEGRLSSEESFNLKSPPQQIMLGDIHMTTSLEAGKAQKGNGGRNIALAMAAVVVLAGAGGWYWWSESGVRCKLDGAGVTPVQLFNVIETPQGLSVSGADPQIVVAVPTSEASQRACIALTINSEKADLLEIFLPDPESDKDSFAAGRSIRQELDAGQNDIRLELPDHTKGRMIRVDPVAGPTRSTVSSIQFGGIWGK